MYDNIISLINKIYALQPIIETYEEIQLSDGSIRKVKKNVLIQDYYNLKDDTNRNISFNNAIDFIEKNRKYIIPQIVNLTMTILEGNYNLKSRIDEQTYNVLKSEYKETDDIVEHFNWCVKVLFALGIITDAKRITYQALLDENGALLCVKKEGKDYKIKGTMVKGDEQGDENISDDIE